MRVQFTNEESNIIEESRASGLKPQESYVPSELEGKVATLGVLVSDPYKFNMFIKKYLEDPEIKDQIGAELVHMELMPPIERASALFLQTWVNNYINGMVYGPVQAQPEQPQEQPVAPEGQPEETTEEESGMMEEEIVSEKEESNVELPSDEEEDDEDYGEIDSKEDTDEDSNS